MNKTFQSFVFGCRVNEAERIKIDKELVEAGFTVDLASPSFLIINTCAITGKAEREAKQLIYQLRTQYPQAQIVVTGCSATMWMHYKATSTCQVNKASADKQEIVFVPNEKKSNLVSLLLADRNMRGGVALADDAATQQAIDKFRFSNRLLVKIQDGCHRFCSYCIVPYLRGLPQSQTTASIITYIQSFKPVPSEVILSAINTEAFGIDSKETLIDLIKQVLIKTCVPRLAFGSIHPWSLTDEFLKYYKHTLAKDLRFINFFHVPIQSGSQTMLGYMKREYNITNVIIQLKKLKKIQPNALIATDVIVGFLGETNELFEKTYTLLKESPINRFHVFRFSNRPHTAAYYMKKRIESMSLRAKRSNPNEIAASPAAPRNDIVLFEPTPEEKKERSNRLIMLSKQKYQSFIETQIGRTCYALIIAKYKRGYKVLLDNHVEGVLNVKHCLPGQVRHVTIIAAKDGVVTCQDS